MSADEHSPILEIQPRIQISRDELKNQVRKHLYFRKIDKDDYSSSVELSLTSEISSPSDDETTRKKEIPNQIKRESRPRNKKNTVRYDEKSENEDFSHSTDSYKPSSESDSEKENQASNSQKPEFGVKKQKKKQKNISTQKRPQMTKKEQQRRSLSLDDRDQQEIDFILSKSVMSIDSNVFNNISTIESDLGKISDIYISNDNVLGPYENPVLEDQKENQANKKTIEKSCLENETQQNENEHVVVAKTSNDGLLRKWDKKQACLYCSKLCAKLPRHLVAKHSNETEVANLMCFPLGSEERKLRLEELRKKGNFFHNTNVLKSGSGIIIPKRRSRSTNPQNLLPCPSCFGFYTKTKLSRHYNGCVKRNEKIAKAVQRQGSMLLPISAGASEKLRYNVLAKMNNDQITLVVRQDDLILKLGSKLLTKHAQDPHLNQYISQKMREMARFLIEIRKIYPPIQNLTECINPMFFTKVIEAVRNVSLYNSQTGKYGIPSLALKIGHSLKKCCNIIISESLINGLPLKREMAENFIKLCENEWSINISSGALTTIQRNKWNMPDRLPLTEDIKLLNSYLTEKREEYVTLLKNAEVTIFNWSTLAKVVLAQTLLFNRRRAGEVERIPVEVYANKLTADKNVDQSISETLSEFEQAISRTFVRFQIRGKKGRGVPILLYPKLIEAYDILMLYRYHVGIPRENPHFFASGPDSHYRGSDVLRTFAIESGAKQPEALTSTKLRKNVATMSQILNLSNHELDQLATFMGHDIRVHREYYRLPESTIQLAKISKILIAAERGKLHHFKGKNLDEINVDVNRISDDEESSDSENENLVLTSTSNIRREINTPEMPDQHDNEIVIPDNDSTKPRKKRSQKMKKKTTKKKLWTLEEKEVVENYFSKAIIRQKVPGKNECEDCIEKNNTILRNRDWKAVKYFVYNIIQRNQKKNSRD